MKLRIREWLSSRKAEIVFSMFIIFPIFDLVSTYIGVCQRGGVELVEYVVRAGNVIGYLPLSMIFFSSYFFVGALTYRHIKRSGSLGWFLYYFTIMAIAFLFFMGGNLTSLLETKVNLHKARITTYKTEEEYVERLVELDSLIDRERFCRIGIT